LSLSERVVFRPKRIKLANNQRRSAPTGRGKETVGGPTERGFSKDDAVFVVTCLGYEFDTVVPARVARGKKPQVGNLVSGLYRIQGRPSACQIAF